jgi:hypothetical protein
MSNYLYDHPFHIVLGATIIFMFLMFLESSKIRKHYKRKKEIENRRKLKEINKVSQLPIL